MNLSLKLILDSFIGKLLSMFRTPWVCESTSAVNFVKSKVWHWCVHVCVCVHFFPQTVSYSADTVLHVSFLT